MLSYVVPQIGYSEPNAFALKEYILETPKAFSYNNKCPNPELCLHFKVRMKLPQRVVLREHLEIPRK